MIEALPPGMPLVLGAALLPLVPRRARSAYLIGLPLVSFAHLWALPDDLVRELVFFGFELVPVRVDPLSQVFGWVFHLAALLGAIYGLHVRDTLQQAAGLVYAGSAIAATFAGDLISLFVAWEATAIASVFLIWGSRTERAYGSGLRYLVIQIGSGVLLLAGSALHYVDTGSLAFEQLGVTSLGTGLIFLAFGIKAAFPLLHNWLQDAYPEATVAGTVLLSAFTTKLAIYALARGFAGTPILIPIGAAMTAFPVFYAVLENDLRRVLAYSLNNQLGFMVVGVGIGTEMALNGTAAHAFAHIIYKALLFMAMGAVLFRTGTIRASDLGGLYRSMPWTAAFCLVGSASIAAFPLFSGFVAKAFVMNAAAEGFPLTFFVLLFASAGVMDHSGIKIPYFAFFAHDSGRRVEEAPWHMRIAMGIAALLCIVIGVYPAALYGLLPFPTDYAPYDTAHVVTQLQLLLFAALGFGVLMRTGIYPPEVRSVNLDFDWFYRRAAPALIGMGARALERTREALWGGARRGIERAAREASRRRVPQRLLGESWRTGTGALWAVLLLAAYLLLYYAG